MSILSPADDPAPVRCGLKTGANEPMIRVIMSGPTLSVLLVTRDPDVKLVAANLQADGIASRTVCSPRDLQRALASIKGQPVVAVFDAELATDDGFPLEDIYTKLRNLPLLVLLQADSESALPADAQRNTREEFARKPITASVLALRIKALVLA